jgi:hypothetical protein
MQLEVCDDTFRFQSGDTCQFVCKDGSCGGECVPGAKDCVGQTPRVCDSSGKWVDLNNCDARCEGGDCVGGDCKPGDRRCRADGKLQICGDDGQWGKAVRCLVACMAGTCI